MCLTRYFIYLQMVPLEAVGTLNLVDWPLIYHGCDVTSMSLVGSLMALTHSLTHSLTH